MQDFKDLKELINHFQDEKVCWDYLEEQLWKGKPVCPHCGSTKAYRLTANYKQFHCGNKKGCNKKFTVTVGTIYENTKIPLSTWFAAIWLITAHKKGISSCQLARDLSVTQKTAWFLLHRIREMVTVHNQIKLSDTVQADETYVKGKAKNRTKYQGKLIVEGKRKDEATIVFAMVSDRAVMKVVPNTESNTLYPVIKDTVPSPETTIVTDGFHTYRGLEMIYKGHIIINHANDEYKVGQYHTNTVEGLFSLVKRGIIGIYHFVSAKHLQRYLEEFSHRYNSRKIKDVDRFILTIQNGQGRLKYKDLIKKIG